MIAPKPRERLIVGPPAPGGPICQDLLPPRRYSGQTRAAPFWERTRCARRHTSAKIHWTGFADEARAKFLEHFIHREQNSPEAAHGFRVVRSVNLVLVKRNG